MDEALVKDITVMTKEYKALANKLGLTLTELLLVISNSELIILNEKKSADIVLQ